MHDGTMITITNENNMDLMARYPDKYFDLAIVDPPYGDASGSVEWDPRGKIPPAERGKKYSEISTSTGRGLHVIHPNWANQKRGRFGGNFDKYKVERTGGAWAAKYGKHIKHWDVAPNKSYFEELFRVSDKVIIWGYNYFSNILPPSRNFIVWQKLTISETFTMAMAELAWTNIPGNAKVIPCAPQDRERFHPTQKPVKIYRKLLEWYSKPGYKILDTHLGSGSIALACLDFACDLTACEIDPNYYHAAVRRVEEYQRQKPLFDMAELIAQQGERSLFDGDGEQW